MLMCQQLFCAKYSNKLCFMDILSTIIVSQYMNSILFYKKNTYPPPSLNNKWCVPKWSVFACGFCLRCSAPSALHAIRSAHGRDYPQVDENIFCCDDKYLNMKSRLWYNAC